MKKKILSVATMLMMVISVFPKTSVYAQTIDTDETYNLTADRIVTDPIEISAGKTVTVDLNGYNITPAAGQSAIINHGGTLIIKDSGHKNGTDTVYGTVTVSANGSATAAIKSEPGSTTTVEGGSYVATGQYSFAFVNAPTSTAHLYGGNYSGSYYVVKNLGTMDIKNATVSSTTATGTNASMVVNGYSGYYTSKAAVVGNDGGYDRKEYTSVTPTLTIDSGSFGTGTSTAMAAVKNDDFGVLTINGGEFVATGKAVNNANIATINGGTFKSSAVAVASDATTTKTGAVITNNKDYGENTAELTACAGQLTINGGTFTATSENGIVLWNRNDKVSGVERDNTGTITVNGGSYTGVIVDNKTTDTTKASVTTITAGTFKTTEGTALNVSAYVPVTSSYDSTTGTVTLKNTTELTKYVLYRGVPSDVTFSYTLTKGDTTAAEDKVLVTAGSYNEEIRNGMTTGLKTVASVTFNSTDFNNGNPSTELDTTKFTDTESAKMDSNHKYSTKQIKLDFSEVDFKNPGVYRYLLTETSSASGLYPVSNPLYVDVYVNRMSKDSSSNLYSTLYVQAIIAHVKGEAEPSTAYDNTADGVDTLSPKTNYLLTACTMKPVSLTVKHYSLGNQASRTNDFSYKLTLSNVTAGAKISYIRSNAKSNTNTTGEFTVGSDGTYAFSFTLKDHEAISFTNMPQDPKYKLELVDDSAKAVGFTQATKFENYQLVGSTDTNAIVDTTTATSVASNTADTKTGESVSSGSGESEVYTGGSTIVANNALATKSQSASYYSVEDTKLTNDTTVVFSVYKEGTIPTGVIVNVAPYAVVVLAGFFGIIVFALKRRNKDEEEA